MRDPDRRVIHWLVAGAAMLSLVSGAIHLWLAPAHFEEWWGYGVFFVAAGALQLLFVIALIWRRRSPPYPRRWIMTLGILGNSALVAFYVFTRIVGVPLGPEAGEVESVKLADVVAKMAEVFLVGALTVLVISRRVAGAGEHPPGQFPGAP